MQETKTDDHPLDWFPEDDTGDDRVDSIALIDRARAALEKAKTLADIGAIREIAERARRYASAAKLGKEAENHAALLRIEAERKAGEILAQTPKHRGNPDVVRSQNVTALPPKEGAPRLADIGVTKRQSADWQRMAKVPEAKLREHVEQVKKSGKVVTTDSVVQIARKIEKDVRAAEPKPIVEPTKIPARLDVASALSLPLDDATVDLIVTSPPYGLDIAYGGGDIAPEAWVTFMRSWLIEALRVTKPSGRLALNVPLDTTKGGIRPTYAQTVMAALGVGWEYRSTVVWNDGQTKKGGWALGSQNSSARPYHVSQVEMIGLFTKGEWAPSSTNPDDITSDQFLEAGRGPWVFPGESSAWEGHPAPFPIELPRRLIRYLCRCDDVVLDPFVGSGTTAIAAIQTGRQAIGFDISEAYIQSARRRAHAATIRRP